MSEATGAAADRKSEFVNRQFQGQRQSAAGHPIQLLGAPVTPMIARGTTLSPVPSMAELTSANKRAAAGRPSSIPKRAAFLAWALILAVDGISLYFFASHGLSNLYGDGIAHVDGARRIFDSLTPGYAAIGTVWLPLFHVLASPLAINDTLWRTGLAGSLISAAAFALTAWLLFRCSWEMNASPGAAVLTLAIVLAGLNVLYFAAAPMTEMLAIFWTTAIAYGLFRFQQSGKTSHLALAAAAAFFGALTRYGAWYLLPFAAAFVFLCRRRAWIARIRQTALFSAIAGAGPVLWLLHNAIRYHNPLEFYSGAGSAKAIYMHQLATTGFRYPTDGSLWLSAHYYVEDLRLVLGPWSLVLAALGALIWLWDAEMRKRRAAALLLLFPLPFYIQGMAFSSVALYVPTLFPHTYYNLRYGLEMAPAVAIFPGFLISAKLKPFTRRAALTVCLLVIAGQFLRTIRLGASRIPVVREAILNTPCKAAAQRDVIRFFKSYYDGENIILADGEWPCVMPQTGIPFRKTVTPDNRKYWRKLRFGAARYAGWVLLKQGDPVDQLMRAHPAAFADFQLAARNSLPRGSYVEIFHRERQQR